MKRIAIPVASLWVLTLLCTTALAAQQTEIGNGRVVTRDLNGVKSIQLDGDGNEPDHVLIGFAGSKPADVDLIVVDPSSDFSALEPVFIVDASAGALSLGSGGAELEGEDGEIYVEDGFGNTSFQVEGSTGNARQVVSGNGLVKGWAKINADGTVHSCWNCNSDPAQTKICCDGLVHYEVDFLLGDISTRPYLVVTGKHIAALRPPPGNTQDQPIIFAAVTPRFGDPSSVYVQLVDGSLSFHVNEDFTVFVF